MADLVGRNLGKYRIVARLGQGGMAEVYKGYQPGLDRYVSIKVLHSHLADDEDFIERFEREAAAIAKLRHPHIVQVYDFDIEDGRYYMVMEFVEGPTLKTELKERSVQGQIFTLSETTRIITALASAIDYAHSRGMVHRDLKPSNIMFSSEGQALLTDFGIARIVGATRLTLTGAIAGTPAYMAPEQGQGERADERSDIYSLGVILYEMMTGRVPFDADTPFAIILRHINDPLPLPTEVNPGIPEAVERVILKAMSKNPDDRYQSAGEMAKSLREAVGVSTEQEIATAPVATIAPRPRVKEMAAKPEMDRASPSFPAASPAQIDLPEPSLLTSLERLGWPVALLLLFATIIILTVTPVGDRLVTSLGNVISQIASWAVTYWFLVVLAIVATVAVTGRRAIGSSVSHVGDALQRWQERSSRSSSSDTPRSTRDAVSPAEPRLTTKPPAVDVPSMILKPEHTSWASHAEKHVVEDLILQGNLDRLKSFIVDSEGGRFVLTGYGRFGGTSLIKGAMSRARRELRERGLSDGALLVFYFNVEESNDGTEEFRIEANEFSFGRLTAQVDDTTANLELDALRAYADSADQTPKETSPASGTLHFVLEKPLSDSFFNQSGLTTFFVRKPEVTDFDFTKLATELNDFFLSHKDNTDLQEIVLKLLGSKALPSRVVFILDRIRRLETLETLAQFRLFRNERMTVIAVARKEDLDHWEDCDKRLNAIRFKKWYVPCVWQRGVNYVQRIEQSLLEPRGFQGLEMGDTVVSLRKHLQFMGKGTLGDTLAELKHPKYWSGDGKGNLYLRLDALPNQSNIQHNAWLQDVLDLNWSAILAYLFAGKELEEREDRARIGIYHLLDWLAQEQIFSKDQFMEAAHNSEITISDNKDVVDEVVQNLLRVLVRNRYLQLKNNQYRVMWDKSAPPKPRKVGVRISTAPSAPPEPTVSPPEQIVSDEAAQDLTVVRSVGKVPSTGKKQVIEVRDNGTIVTIEDLGHTTSGHAATDGETKKSERTKILFFASDPSDTPRLALDEEIHSIEAKIRSAEYRGVLKLIPALAARPDDFLQKLNEHKPQIVHFSGHGSEAGEIFLLDNNREAKPVSTVALKALFTTMKDNIRVVVLNACYSQLQAEAIAEVIDCVIGMSEAIGDESAATFAASFYRAISFGRSVKDAFDQGTTALLLEGISEEDVPQLIVRPGVDPSLIMLIDESAQNYMSREVQ